MCRPAGPVSQQNAVSMGCLSGCWGCREGELSGASAPRTLAESSPCHALQGTVAAPREDRRALASQSLEKGNTPLGWDALFFRGTEASA